MPKPNLEGVRWEPEERWHVTVRYFGHLEPREIDALVEQATRLGGAEGPVGVSLGPATERLGRDGTLIVPARGVDGMADALARATIDLGPPSTFPFVGHLTLARCRRTQHLDDALLGVAIDTGFTATTLDLLASEQTPEGSRYSVIAEIPLAG